eukprot:6804586-Prymnesium_polylepis.1
MCCGERLVRSLRASGFAVVRAPHAAAIGRKAVDAWADSGGGFRFPCGEAYPECEHLYRVAFDELYAVASQCMHSIAAYEGGRLQQLCGAPTNPSGEAFDGIRRGDWPFPASFASIFNYDHGFLNPHQDRGSRAWT